MSDKTQEYYYIDSKKQYETISPSFRDNIIKLYGLQPVADSLARTNPTTGQAGVKLRKSYKNHINDLPGKHAIPSERNLSPIVFGVNNNAVSASSDIIKVLPMAELQKSFKFEKTSINGIPGFDSTKLAIDTSSSSNKKRVQTASPPELASEPKRRHVQVHFD